MSSPVDEAEQPLPLDIQFVCAHHRPFPHSDSPHFLNIHAGRAAATVSLPFIGDDTGDHISDLNPHFSELTALYWYWKNHPMAEHVGSCHYRRYFDLRRTWAGDPMGAPTPKRGWQIDVPNGEFGRTGVDSARTLRRIRRSLGRGPVLLPHRWDLHMSLGVQYLKAHRSQDWSNVLELLDDKDAEMGACARAFFAQETRLHAWNMFVMRRDVFEEYMTFMFGILLPLHEMTDYPNDAYQRRMPAFVAERLTSFFVHWTQMAYRSAPIIYFEG